MLQHYITRRPRSRFFQLRVPLPVDIQHATGRKEFTKSLKTEDRKVAQAQAVNELSALYGEWESIRSGKLVVNVPGAPTPFDLLRLVADAYEETKGIVERHRIERFASNPQGFEDYLRHWESELIKVCRMVEANDLDRWAGPAIRILNKNGFRVDQGSDWFGEFVRQVAEATIDAIHVFNLRDRGERGAKPSSEIVIRALSQTRNPSLGGDPELPFLELANLYMIQWLTTTARDKETNTEQQKRATFSLFAGFWGNKPIRSVTDADAARFHDAVKLLDPNWARSPKARAFAWSELQASFGDHQRGLLSSP